MDALPVPTTEGYLEFVRRAIARHHDKNERLRFVIAPSGPQRCTEDLLTGALELAHEHDTAYHTHVLETKMQAVTGEEHYGKSLIRHMHDIGILGERTTIAHAVWVSDEDIALMADAGCSVVHNPISNLKLGSGIAPYRKLLDAGINLALGSDAPSASDTPRMFDVMKFAGLIHKVATPDYTRWPRAAEIVRAATINGARSAALGAKVGSLEAGKKADLLILDLRSLNFTPLNDIDMHLVYCEDGRSVETVMVAGEIVVEDGRVLTCDEAEITQEFRKQMVEFIDDAGGDRAAQSGARARLCRYPPPLQRPGCRYEPLRERFRDVVRPGPARRRAIVAIGRRSIAPTAQPHITIRYLRAISGSAWNAAGVPVKATRPRSTT